MIKLLSLISVLLVAAGCTPQQSVTASTIKGAVVDAVREANRAEIRAAFHVICESGDIGVVIEEFADRPGAWTALCRPTSTQEIAP